MTSKQTSFKNNAEGVLNHDGTMRVTENHDVLQKIVFLRGKEIHLQNRAGKKYRAEIHKNLDLTFAEEGDVALVKFNCGKPYVVGFKKELRK